MRLVGCNPIDTSPAPQVVNEGEPATFRVSASTSNETDNLAYQWKKDGVDIAGATGPVYTVASVTTAQVGMYTVAVTVSSTGMVFTSQGAALTIGTGVLQENMRHVDDAKAVTAEDIKNCGCGSGTGLALLPPFIFKAMARRRRKKRNGTMAGGNAAT